MAPLRRRGGDDEFDFKRSADELKAANEEPWFLGEDVEGGDVDVEAGRSARFEGGPAGTPAEE